MCLNCQRSSAYRIRAATDKGQLESEMQNTVNAADDTRRPLNFGCEGSLIFCWQRFTFDSSTSPLLSNWQTHLLPMIWKNSGQKDKDFPSSLSVDSTQLDLKVQPRRVPNLGTSESLPCSLQMMWFCWLQQTTTFSTHRAGSHSSVKRSGRESAPPSLRPWWPAPR